MGLGFFCAYRDTTVISCFSAKILLGENGKLFSASVLRCKSGFEFFVIPAYPSGKIEPQRSQRGLKPQPNGKSVPLLGNLVLVYQPSFLNSTQLCYVRAFRLFRVSFASSGLRKFIRVAHPRTVISTLNPHLFLDESSV